MYAVHHTLPSQDTSTPEDRKETILKTHIQIQLYFLPFRCILNSFQSHFFYFLRVALGSFIIKFAPLKKVKILSKGEDPSFANQIVALAPLMVFAVFDDVFYHVFIHVFTHVFCYFPSII
jgi:hypothetical protein